MPDFRIALHLLVLSAVALYQSFLDSKLQFLYGVGGDYEHEGEREKQEEKGDVLRKQTISHSFIGEKSHSTDGMS